MKLWDKLLQADVKDKARFQNLFSETVGAVGAGNFPLNAGETEYSDYWIVIEEDRVASHFIHIVPKEVYALFKEMQASAPNDMLGFSVLAGKHEGKDVRVSCFGVQCNLLGKSLFKKN
jgi:hypothetical protein